MELFHPVKPLVDGLGKQHACHKGQQGHQIMPHPLKIALAQVGGQQHDVPGLRIGEHLAPADVGVGILKTAGEG